MFCIKSMSMKLYTPRQCQMKIKWTRSNKISIIHSSVPNRNIGLNGAVILICLTLIVMGTITRHWTDTDRSLTSLSFNSFKRQTNEYCFSICANPTEIDARMIENGYDWAYSDSVLIHHSRNYTDKLWNIGISRYGYVNSWQE